MPYTQIDDKITLFYEEYGQGDKIILSAQVGFYPVGMQQQLGKMGYHVYCITLRGFHPSTLVEEDYGQAWYDIFADDVVAFADKMNIKSLHYKKIDYLCQKGYLTTKKYIEETKKIRK